MQKRSDINLSYYLVAKQIIRDRYPGFVDAIYSALSTPKSKLITTLASAFIYTNIANVSSGAIKDPFKPEEYMRELSTRLISQEGREILLSGLEQKPSLVEGYRAPAYKPQAEKREKVQLQKKPAYIVYDPRKGISEDLKRTLSEAGIKIDLEEYKPSPVEKQDFSEEIKKSLARMPREDLKTKAPSEQEKKYTAETKEPWSIGNDLNQYRNHAVEQGSRDSGKNLEKALSHIGLTIEDLANVITLAYGSDRAKQFRANDGKPLSFHLKKVGEAGGWTIVNITDGGYSIADLILLDSLPNIKKEAYQNNHPLVRPFVFTGSAMGSAWKTVENTGNVPTLGLFDNLTGSAGMCIEDIVESLKHTGEAGTNLTRGPFYLVFGKSKNLDKTLDWVLLVPFEYVSNVIEMKGISNMQNYKNAFRNKGVIGSIAELGGSGYLAIRSVDEIVEELEHEPSKKRAVVEEQEPELPEPPYKPPRPGKIIIIEPRPPRPPFEMPCVEPRPPLPPFEQVLGGY